jgi:hypothetical protein
MSRQALVTFLTDVLVGPMDSVLPPVPSIDSFVITCDRDTPWHCEALWSTLASARTPVEFLEIRNGFRKLELLAEALFYPRSFSGSCPTSIRGLSLRDPAFSSIYLVEMANVVDEKDGQFRIVHRSGQRLLLREGTTFRSAEARDSEVATNIDVVLPLQFKANRKLLDDNARTSRTVDVVVPGYGHCSVPREAAVICPAKGGQAEGEPLSLLSFYHGASVEALNALLDRIGWSLKRLTLQHFRKLDDTKLMASIMRTCPLLTSLDICPCQMNLKRLVSAYERVGKTSSTGISSLELERVGGIGRDHGVAFAKLLGDPSSHLAKHLKTFAI